jgi:hypothetical protein
MGKMKDKLSKSEVIELCIKEFNKMKAFELRLFAIEHLGIDENLIYRK